MAFPAKLLIPSTGVGSGKSLRQLCFLVAFGGSPCLARAETAPEPSPSDPPLGDTSDALPGVHRVGVAGLAGPRAGASFNLLYGYTEPQNGASSSHQRMGGSLAAAIAPWSFAALGVRADFRHDLHGSDNEGSDSGSVVDLTPHLRFGAEIGEGFRLGAEGRAKLLGATVGESGGPDPEVDARALFGYSGLPTWIFALHAGYKIGQDGDVLDDATNMRAGDRVALGVSEFDALLFGLGVVKSLGKTEVLAELTSEMLLGSDAPSFLESPLRAAGGIRHSLMKNLWFSGLVEATLGSRAASLPGDPLVPIEPRVVGLLGITWRFLAPKERVPTAAPVEEKPTPEVTNQKTDQEPVPEGPPPVVLSKIQVTVVDAKGHPISDADVTIEVPGSEAEGGGSRPVPLVDRNVYVIGEVPLGEVEVTVSADLLKSQTQTIDLKSSETAALEFKLEKAADVGSQLRGLVRSYAGEGLKASVRVEPGDLTVSCDAEGSFELDLPPGVYKVIIEAEGYRSQRRTLRVRKEGVTVLNADLQKNTD